MYVQEEPGHDTTEVLASVEKQTVFGEAITADPAGNYNTALLHLHRGTASFCAVQTMQLLTQWNVPNVISKKLLRSGISTSV